MTSIYRYWRVSGRRRVVRCTVESGRSCQYINNMDTAGKWVCRPGQRARLRLAGRRLRSRAIEHHEMHRLEQRGTARWISLGAPGRIRTCDLGIRSPLLYPLSYGRSPEARVPPVGDSCRIRPRDLQKRGGSAESARNWGATRARRISRSRSLMCSPCARASPTCTAGLCVTGRPGSTGGGTSWHGRSGPRLHSVSTGSQVWVRAEPRIGSLGRWVWWRSVQPRRSGGPRAT
jgi:hypothetical protein